MARPPFIAGFDYRGVWAYSLTCCTFRRQRHFADADASGAAIALLESTALECEFAVLAYCVMPDHFHGLTQGTAATAEFRPFVRLWRQRTAVRFSRQFGTRLWQPGYFERVVRNHEDLGRVAEYIIHNPVRAGLVTSLDAWPWIGGRLVRR